MSSPSELTNSPAWSWIAQLGLFLLGGVFYLFFPAFSLVALSGRPEGALSQLAVDQLRMSSPYLYGLGGFTLFALMTRRTALAPRFALVFGFTIGLWSAVQWEGVVAGRYATAGIIAAVLASVLALLNLRYAWEARGERLGPEQGVEGTKPPYAFLLWGLQGLVLLAGSLAFVIAPAAVLTRISSDPYGSPLLSAQAVDQARLLGALATGMALLSWVALSSQHDFAWRGFCFFFAWFLAVWVVSIGWILTWGHYALPVLAVLLPGLVFLPMNLWLRRLHGEWDPKGVSRMPEAWGVIDLVAGPIMGLFVLLTKRRSSHLVGVGARGVFRVADPLEAPPNELFAAGAERPVQVRFANLTELDDASLDVRGCSIKFSEHRHDSPFDLLLNTGSFCPAFNLWTFAGFVASKLVPTKGSEILVQNNLIAREGGVAGLRRGPESYARLYYYGQIVREWVRQPDGVLHLVRYRCVPADLGQESGLPSDEDAAHIWIRDRLPGDDRPPNYLRQELRDRLAEGPVHMRLQGQFHRPHPGDSLEWFNASVDWDGSTHPWLDLGRIELHEALDDPDTELLQFDPGNHPLTLGIPSGPSASDYRSMGDSEARVVRALQRLRLWMYGAFGFPSFDPGMRQ